MPSDGFCCFSGPQSKSKQKDKQILGHCQRTKKAAIAVGAVETVPKGLKKETGRYGNGRKKRDYKEYSVVEIS